MASSSNGSWETDLRDSVRTNFGQGWLVNGETSGKTKIEQPFNTPLLSEVKAEISYDINKDSQIVFALHHRCTFFGLLTPNDGESFGQHWYNIGYRYSF
jgi:hypothetical protein